MRWEGKMTGTLRRMRSRIKGKTTSIGGNKAHKVKEFLILQFF